MTRRTFSTVALVALMLGVIGPNDAHPQLAGQSLSEGDRPSVSGVIGGAALGGLAFSAGAALVGLAVSGGSMDCYGGGCATLLLLTSAWPLGSAFGATRAIRRQGYDVGFPRLMAYSLLGTGLGVLTAFAVDSRGTPDWVYGAAPLAAHFGTMALLSYATIQFHEETPAFSFAPAILDGAPGITGQIAFR
jgi:hypothetical protein